MLNDEADRLVIAAAARQEAEERFRQAEEALTSGLADLGRALAEGPS